MRIEIRSIHLNNDARNGGVGSLSLREGERVIGAELGGSGIWVHVVCDAPEERTER